MSDSASSRKSPFLAIALSMLFTGAGQVYNGRLLKGVVCIVLFAAASAASAFTIVFALEDGPDSLLLVLLAPPALWVWGVIDAGRDARRINARIADPAA